MLLDRPSLPHPLRPSMYLNSCPLAVLLLSATLLLLPDLPAAIAQTTDPKKEETKRVRNVLLSQNIPINPNLTGDIPIPTNSNGNIPISPTLSDDIPIGPAPSPNRPIKLPSLRLPDAPPDSRLGEANRLGQQGEKDYEAQQYQAAIRSWEQALVLYRQLQDRRGEGLALSDLGRAYRSLSQYEQAIDYYKKALPIFQSIQDRSNEADVLTNLGVVYYSLSQYERAISYYKNALSIFQVVQDRNGEAYVLGNLGIVYNSLSQDEQAINYYQKALSIFQAVQDRNSEAKTLNNLGLVYDSLSQYKQAINYYQQALPIYQAVRDRNGEAKVLTNLGLAYDSLSQYEQAIVYHQKALSIFQAVQDRNSEAATLNNLGLVYDSLSQYKQAINYYQQALPIYQVVKDRDGEAKVLNNWGLGLYKWGKFVEAEGRLYASIILRESIRADLNSDQNKVSIFENQASSYRNLQRVLIAQGKVEQGLEVAERGRSRAFVELLVAKQANTNQPPAVNSIKIAAIKKIAKDQNATLLQYSLVSNIDKEQSIYIWVISFTGDITFRKVDLKPLKQQNTSLAQLVNQSRAVIGARGRADVEVALSPEFLKRQQEQQIHNLKQLHQILIEPIADLLPQDPHQRIIFMPQGELFLVPFPALLDANNKSLIEQHTILTAPSIQVLELTRQQRQARQNSTSKMQNALVVGNPVMPQVVTQVGKTPVQLSDLPGAQREALAIADLLKTKAITGAQATESAIAQQMPHARIIHLATHGLLDDTKGLGVPGAIALAPVGNGQLNDGLLTSDEILDMKLNAELVVLSACDTGRGGITGDGVIGLSRSLITAGVPSIVVSLWKVPDDSTALLMTEFYKNLSTTNDKAQALRQAMLTTKQKYSDPLHWAAFTLIGEAE